MAGSVVNLLQKKAAMKTRAEDLILREKPVGEKALVFGFLRYHF